MKTMHNYEERSQQSKTLEMPFGNNRNYGMVSLILMLSAFILPFGYIFFALLSPLLIVVSTAFAGAGLVNGKDKKIAWASIIIGFIGEILVLALIMDIL